MNNLSISLILGIALFNAVVILTFAVEHWRLERILIKWVTSVGKLREVEQQILAVSMDVHSLSLRLAKAIEKRSN